MRRPFIGAPVHNRVTDSHVLHSLLVSQPKNPSISRLVALLARGNKDVLDQANGHFIFKQATRNKLSGVFPDDHWPAVRSVGINPAAVSKP
ncbi:hypothetical protein SUGI_0273610 [Cryptomeria japonica]|nr:hypothetical protein SUGI_0273610 [Cryptomeria japonica]